MSAGDALEIAEPMGLDSVKMRLKSSRRQYWAAWDTPKLELAPMNMATKIMAIIRAVALLIRPRMPPMIIRQVEMIMALRVPSFWSRMPRTKEPMQPKIMTRAMTVV